jgi:Barrel-sandwich domain of CusB or HlyD membrane-fusion
MFVKKKLSILRSSVRGAIPPVVLAAAAAGALFGLSGCGKDDANAGGQKGRERPPALVRVEPIERRSLSPRVVVVGSVTAIKTSIVASGSAGIVDSYSASEGEWVEAGTELSQLRMKATLAEYRQAKEVLAQREAEYQESLKPRKEDVDQAKSKMEAARILKDTAAERLRRGQDAFKQGAINQDQLDDLKEKSKETAFLFAAAEAEYTRVNAGLRPEKIQQAKAVRDAQREQILFLEAEMEKRTTLAPFSGFVVKEQSYKGQWLAKGDPVATIAMLGAVDVIVNVDQSDISHVQLGRQASVDIQDLNLSVVELRGNPKSETRNPKESRSTKSEIPKRADIGDLDIRNSKSEIPSDFGFGDSNLRASTIRGVIENESAVQIVLVDEQGLRHTIAKSDVLSRRTVPWTGTVTQIVSRSDWKTGSRGFPVKVRIPNRFRYVPMATGNLWGPVRLRKQPLLKEGMMATVTFQGRRIDAYLVPKDAVVRTTQGMKVNIFQPSKDDPKRGSTVQLRVNTGVGVGEWIQISPNPANPGEPQTLSEGMQVVTDGAERLLPVQANVVVAGKPLSKK